MMNSAGHLLLRGFTPLFVAGLTVVAVAACSSGSTSDPTQPAATATAEPSASIFGEDQHEWTVVSEDIDVVLATPDLGIGDQRFALVLSDSQGLIKFPVVEFDSYKYPNGFEGERVGPVQSERARFSEFPFGTRGIHVTHLDFDSTGDWAVEATVPRADGTYTTAEVRFPVYEEPHSVAVGEPVPASHNRTLADVGSISELTTGSYHDEELYRYTVADAIERHRPFVVVFASPAFCTNAVCGPQVEVASELREMYGADADFIHVDLFENPQEIKGDLSRAVETELLDEWGLVSQEWTYVVGADGLVVARFENFVAAGELSEAIETAINVSENA